MDIKDLHKEACRSGSGERVVAAYMIAQSNLEIAKAQMAVATAIEKAGEKIFNGFVHISNRR